MVKKLTFEFVKEQFYKRNYKLVSTEYINANKKLDYICPKGHSGSISYNHVQRGHGCNICGIKKKADKLRHNIDFVRSEFENRGYKLISTEYIDNSTKLDYICPNGHCGNISYDKLKQGRGCAICGIKSMKNKLKHTIEFICYEFEKRNYKLISKEYINNKTKLDYICDKGHLGSIIYNSFEKGSGCPQCCQGRSEILSREIFEDIMGVKFPSGKYKFLTNPDTGNPLELDGYSKELNLAFEYQGRQHYKFVDHFHKTEDIFKKSQERDRFKYKKCVELGITLILIPYKFNCYNPEELKTYIRDQLISHKLIFLI